ncbi:MAG: asparagine synthase (glutamine-hydrolyzing) [Vicinamibacteria bacterium]
MCGIAGIVSLSRALPIEAQRLRQMRDSLAHRGPDGAGEHFDGPVALGHRRLAIVDVAGGAQPMPNEDDSVWISFNGEIYNHLALRPGLEALGHRYRTRSDTETILHLYEEEGERCVERLRGMFAFAIWDQRRRQLLLARDRLGIKPLYYAVAGGELLFASEIKALLAGGLRPELNAGALPEFLANRFVAGEETLFKGVRRLLPGRTLRWSAADGFVERRYWELPAGERQPAEPSGDAALDLRERLREAVSAHLMSDVPLGIFLSGGLDSSGLLALMAPLVPDRVRSFAVGFAEREADELRFARMAARAAGCRHSELVVTPRQFFDELPRLVWHEDEPIAFPSSVPLFLLSRLAREQVKVVLTGEGADELFLGYERYRLTAWNARLGRPYWELIPHAARRHIAGLARALPAGVRRYAARSFLALEPGPRSLFCENFAVFPGALLRRVLAEPALLAGRDPHGETLRAYAEAGGDLLDRMSRTDLQTYLVRLLMKQDQMSMAASIESRVPYLDHGLVEHVAALPGSLKLRGLTTKLLLRSALRDLVPRPILSRRKMGFPVPVGRWLRGPFWSAVRELVLSPRALERGLLDAGEVRRLAEAHRSGREDHGDRLWLLLNLEIWQRVFLDGDSFAGVRAA